MNKFWKNVIMFIIAFSVYISMEVVWDNTSHISMGGIAGTIFIFGNWLNNKFSWKMDLLLQCGIITVFTTILEAIVGNIDYYFWHLNIWDYSNLPLSYFNSKVNVFFIMIWLFLSLVVILVADAIEYYWFHEGEQPEYWIFGKKVWQMPKRKCHE